MSMWDALSAAGIHVRRRTLGHEKLTCPKCNDSRKKKNDKCLYVRIDTGEIRWHCFNCEFKGKATDGTQSERPAVGRRAKHKPLDLGTARRRERYNGYSRE